MKVNHLGNGIVAFEDLLSKEELEEINLSLIEETIEAQGYNKVEQKTFMEGGHFIPEEDLPTMPIRYIKDIQSLSFVQKINQAMHRAAIEYCKLFPVAAECITDYSGMHFVKYLPKGIMGPHSDTSLGYKPNSIEATSTVAIGNTLTASLLLNDEFTGGGIYFNNWDIEVHPKAGSALFYPSNFIGAHEVREITSGFRWIYLAFYSHGDRTYVSTNSNNHYTQRYEWTNNFRNEIRKELLTKEENLNLLQKKVENGYQ
jgi:hypothetical protein